MTESLVIFCGGLSQRMGQDKAQLVFQGENLLARHIRLAEEQGMRVYAANGGNVYDLPDSVQQVDDALPDHGGPLSALAGALRVLQEECLSDTLLMPVDTLVSPVQLQNALPRQKDVPFSCMVADGKPQPLFARIAVALLPHIEQWLEADMRRMMPLTTLSGARYAEVPAGWPQPLAFNTREGWQAALVHAGESA